MHELLTIHGMNRASVFHMIVCVSKKIISQLKVFSHDQRRFYSYTISKSVLALTRILQCGVFVEVP
jgi:hypothetical protein